MVAVLLILATPLLLPIHSARFGLEKSAFNALIEPILIQMVSALPLVLNVNPLINPQELALAASLDILL